MTIVGGRLPEPTPEERELAIKAFTDKCGGMEGLQQLFEQQQAQKALKHLGTPLRKKQKTARLKALKLGRSQCKARTRTGARCARPTLPDGTECSQHRGVVRWINKKGRWNCPR